jgi:hypothetical protein
VILVPAATTAAWLANQYVMEGFATLASTGERHRIYYGTLNVSTNLPVTPATQPVKTFKQKALEAAENAYLKALNNNIVESDVEGTKIVREQRKSTYAAYATAYTDRQNEIALERSQNCQPTGNKVKSRFMITNMGGFPWQGGGVIGTQG